MNIVYLTTYSRIRSIDIQTCFGFFLSSLTEIIGMLLAFEQYWSFKTIGTTVIIITDVE